MSTINIEKVVDLVKNLKSKKDILEAFIKFYSHLPEQGSPLWLKEKRGSEHKPPTVGGSEISILINKNKYQQIHDLADRKLGISDFTGSIATRWGNVLEEVINMITECILSTKVHETGSIPGLVNEDGHIIQSYSPDGLAVVDSEKYEDALCLANNELDNEYKTQLDMLDQKNKKWIVLLEYKCPFRRIPKGEVPEHYISQPQIGMCTIPIADIALFVDGMFRKCRVTNFGFNIKYDKYFHNSDKRCLKEPLQKPFVCGFIGFYNTAEQFDADYEETEKLPRPTLEEKEVIANELQELVEKEVQRKGSDFYNIKFKYKNISSIISISNLFLDYLYDHHILFSTHQWDPKDEEEVIFLTCKNLMNLKSKLQKLVKIIIPDALNVGVRRRRKYDLNELEFGTDFGHTDNYNMDSRGCTVDEFEDIMKEVVDDRFKEKGYRAYYPQHMYYQEQDEDKFNSGQNYIDRTRLPEDQARRWLYENVDQFIKFCQKNNYKPVGILPWKLFRLHMTPVFKNKEFLTKLTPHITSFVTKVEGVKKELKKNNITRDHSEYKSKVEKLIDSTFNRQKARKIPKTYKIKLSEGENDIAGDFSDL